MDAVKEKLLIDTYTRFMHTGLGITPHQDILEDLVADDIMGFGTTSDEKILSLVEFRHLLKTQKEQSQGLQLKWSITPFKHRISTDGNSAVFADEVLGKITLNNEVIELQLRFSVAFEFREDKWVAVHFHGSKAENVESATDTFGIEEWKKRNAELEKLVIERTAELQRSLEELKATQSQLIQSEKMASLGELTAGIAHEIQNPLNFVNNFSEVNTELIEEMKKELRDGNSEEAITIANDIADNEHKINHHGKRADAIVKGMLQHSPSSSGQKEPTNINLLADEYLRLAYHGLRAKDKLFNASMKTDYDETIGNINIIPQDIGRAILNLITNAFYAVGEKKQQHPAGYEPIVSVNTKKIGSHIEIRVADNGNGIPQKILEKVFHPFFTTKPTGQGTGLGLSLSYDIVKAHDGELKVETSEGKGSEFIISLPDVK